MIRIVILTGAELRHDFYRINLANRDGIKVLRTYCESKSKALDNQVRKNETASAEIMREHLRGREVTEKDFFQAYCTDIADHSNPVEIERGKINDPSYVDEIIELRPNLIVAYGCSIIRSRLLETFAGRFINTHLGLSPYYRGAGTNFWPLANGEPQFVGTTFMYIDSGIDTGKIIHQIRARVSPSDTVHTIGNRLIQDSALVAGDLVKAWNYEDGWDRLRERSLDWKTVDFEEKVYRNRDFNAMAVKKLYENMANGQIKKYLQKKEQVDGRYPIYQIKNLARATD